MAGLKKNQSVKNTMIWQGKSGNCETSINVVLIVVEAFGVVKIWKGTVKTGYDYCYYLLMFIILK